MKIKPMIAALRAALFGAKAGRFVGRATAHDVATYPYTSFNYRMPAGFPGDVNRSHPATIEPVVNDPTNPVTSLGFPGIVNGAANSVRGFLASDTAVTRIWGVVVRSFPFQQSNNPSAYGAIGFGVGAPAAGQPMDVLRTGYIFGQMNSSAGPTVKGGPVFVWTAATTGGHTQGGFESVASAGNTAALDITAYFYNGPADVNGVVEIEVNV